MIKDNKIYFASPLRFDTIDFDKVGTGTGVARNGQGIYMGEHHLAKHYLSTYAYYSGADNTYITNNNKLVKESSLVGKQLKALESENPKDNYSCPDPQLIADMYNEINHDTSEMIGRLYSNKYDGLVINGVKGILYEADISNLRIKDESYEISSDEAIEIILTYYDKVESGKRLQSEISELGGISDFDEEIDFELYTESDSPSDAIRLLSADIYNFILEADDQGYVDMNSISELDEDVTLSYLCKKLANDFYSFNDLDKEIEDALGEKFTNKLEDIRDNSLSFELIELNVKSAYQLLYSSLEHGNNDVWLAGEIVAEAADYDGYICSNNMAEIDSFEVVFINRAKQNEVKIKEISPYLSEFDRENDIGFEP